MKILVASVRYRNTAGYCTRMVYDDDDGVCVLHSWNGEYNNNGAGTFVYHVF